jgi:hypothetical protein
MKITLTIILVCVVSLFCHGQNTASTEAKVDSSKIRDAEIIQHLKELKQTENERIEEQPSQELLLEYIRELKGDAQQHREYTEAYLERMLVILTILGSLMAGFFIYLGYSSHSENKKRLEELFNSNNKEQLEKLWKEKSEALDKRMNDLVASMNERMNKVMNEQSHNYRTNLEQDKKLNTLDVTVAGLKKKMKNNTRVTRNFSALTYEAADGSRVLHYREQHIICIAEDDPVTQNNEAIEVDEPGKIELLEWTTSERVKVQTIRKETLCEVNLTFINPLKKEEEPFVKKTTCRLINTFLKDNENWWVNQSNEYGESIVELKFLKERTIIGIHGIQVDKVELDIPIKIDCKISEKTDEKYHTYTVNLPTDDIPARYNIQWRFKE